MVAAPTATPGFLHTYTPTHLHIHRHAWLLHTHTLAHPQPCLAFYILVQHLSFAMTKSSWGENGLLDLHVPVRVHMKEIRAGTWRQELERSWRMLLTSLSLMAHSACFLVLPRTTCPGVKPPIMGSDTNQESLIENALQTGLLAKPMEASSLKLEFTWRSVLETSLFYVVSSRTTKVT